MKQATVFAVLILTLTILATTALGQLTAGDLYREAFAKLSDEQPPYDGLLESFYSEESGAFEAHPGVWWEDGHAQANHFSEITSTGQIISLTGTLQCDMGRGIPGETNVYEAQNLILTEFNSVGSFVIEGNLDLQGTNHESIVSIVDLQTLEAVFTTGVNPSSGDFSAVCGGTGSYRLEISQHFQVYQADTGGSEAVMYFNVTLAPDETVVTESKTLSGIKALFR